MISATTMPPPAKPRSVGVTRPAVIGSDRATAPTESVAHRRVLMICQAFPPIGGPGVQRSAKFAKYLHRCGWRPSVWAADGLDQLPSDPSLTADLPAGMVRHGRRGSAYTSSHLAVMDFLETLGVRRSIGERRWAGLNWRALHLLHQSSLLLFPDDQLSWVLRSIAPLLGLIRREKIEVVFSTYSPVANHLLALIAKLVSGVPWVADFRDLWTDDYCYTPRTRLHAWADRRLEQTILRRADAVVATTTSQARILAERVPEQNDKFTCITNGVDPADFERIDRGEVRSRLHGPTDRFVLAFAGRFLSDRIDQGLIGGLARFAERTRAERGSFEFRVVGSIADAALDRLAGAGVPIQATGYLSHGDAIEQMIAADALLLPAPSGPNASTLIPAKAFEYLAARRPILVVGPPNGEVQQLVRNCAAGTCVRSSPDAVSTALREVWQRWRADAPYEGCSPERLAPFTRERLTQELADVLTSVRPGRLRK
ncbi:MAG: glycosyltransferase family 4 protein [bacterium]|nr:glycosyltransferase family 4 protein [bacterium]